MQGALLQQFLYLPMVEIVSLEQQKRRRHRGRNHSDSTTTTSRMTMACYKRADGSTAQVPGCQMGGEGDVPGADYCYYKLYDDDDDDDNKEEEEDCNVNTRLVRLMCSETLPAVPSN